MKKHDFLDVELFNIKQLDETGKTVLSEFETLFINLRKKKSVLPDEYFNEAKDFLITSCTAQIQAKKKALQHFSREFNKNLAIGCEISCIANQQVRLKTRDNFLDEQKRQKNWLPAKYYFWDRVWFATKCVFFPVTFAYYAVLIPGKIRDKIRISRKEKRVAALSGCVSSTASLVNINPSINAKSHTAADSDAPKNTGEKKESSGKGVSTDSHPPPRKQPMVAKPSITPDELDKIMTGVKTRNGKT